MTRLGAFIALAALVAGPGTASAAPDRQARARAAYAAAQTAYNAGDFKTAAAQYQAAYADEPDPAYLFDIAQAFRLSKQCADAAAFYHRFLVEVPHPPNLAKVMAYIHETETCAAALGPKPPPPQPPQQPPQPQHPAMAPTPDHAHAISLALLATGAVALGTGAFATTRVAHWSSAREAECPMPCTWTTTHQRDAEREDAHGHHFVELSLASYAIGGAALIGGALLYRRKPREAPVEIGLGPTGASISARFRF